MEVFPVRPVRNDVGVGNQHARGVAVGAKNADRFSRLYQQRFVFPQIAQTLKDRLKGRPVASCFADAAINHQIFRALGDIRIEVVLNHAIGCFNQPVLAAQFGPLGSADNAGFGIFVWRIHVHFLL